MMFAERGLKLGLIPRCAFAASAEPILINLLKLSEVVLIVNIVVPGATGVAGVEVRIAIAIGLTLFLLLHHL